ncbi:GH18 domain-containing protein [Caenorhabditis elegans]|uniref:GH18 domain-containing protein n=1 Tax=Caenorhabditis elegans TaxID=6239 RepID=Q17840_CAEEL|nr:GH18 domain-containing protein [Caenorhabditis elegans]CAA91153.1 GH18 domain-containing protein [Caenorhabditis elegans]|eukprot:NP_496132.1 CHItinase-Like [Caenorhabditis elegans]
MPKTYKLAILIFVLLFVFGIVSFLVSSLFCYFYDFSNSVQSPSVLHRKRIIGYVSSDEGSEITIKQLEKLTHVIFAFILVHKDGTIKFKYGTKDGFFDMKRKSMELNRGLKVMVSIGGYESSPLFSDVLVKKKKKLIASIALLVKKFDLDGVDIFWNWPSITDQSNYLIFIRELRKKLTNLKDENGRSNEYVISVIAPSSSSHSEYPYKWTEILENVDFINVITFEYFYEANKIGPHSPLYGGSFGNVDDTLKYLICRTRTPNKLNMVVSFNGIYWGNTTLPFDDKGVWIPDDSAQGPYSYGWKQFARMSHGFDQNDFEWNEETRTPYIWKADTQQFLTFENEKSLTEKMNYAVAHNIGGVAMYTIDDDDEENTLLNVVVTNLPSLKKSGGETKYNCTR